MTDAHGKFEYLNPQLIAFTGITSEESLESQWSKFVHPDDLMKVLRKWSKCLESGKSFSIEHRLRAKDGSFHWFLAKALPSFDDQGKVISWFGSYTNIELQKEAQKVLEKSREHFRMLAELIPEKISHFDTRGNVEYLNQCWMEYSGLKEEELLGQGWLQLLPPDDKESDTALWLENIENGRAFEMELRFRDRNGDYKWHLSRALPIKNEAGKIKQWIASNTEVHRIKEEEKRKEDFLKLVSHELKTPITSVKGYIQLLLSMLERKQVPLSSLPLKKSLVRMNEQIERLTRLISEMLDLSRIEDNRLSLKKQILNLNELVDTVILDLNILKKVPIHLHQETEFEVIADKDRIEQVIINLVTNAIKYSSESEEVELRIFETEDHMAAVSVTDHGIGIPEKDQKEIFKRFYRVSGKDENTYAGLGIGLFLAHEIIERHGGRLQLESKIGAGSTFTFVLPYESKLNKGK